MKVFIYQVRIGKSKMPVTFAINARNKKEAIKKAIECHKEGFIKSSLKEL